MTKTKNIQGKQHMPMQRRIAISIIALLAIGSTPIIWLLANSSGTIRAQTRSQELSQVSLGTIPANGRVEMTALLAEKIVGFKVKEPNFLPTGWQKKSSSVKGITRAKNSVNELFAFEQSWEPTGAKADGHNGLRIIQVKETGRPSAITQLPTIKLVDGTTAYVTTPTSDTPVEGGAVTWWKDGTYNVVSAYGISKSDLMKIANSMVSSTQ